MKTLNERNDEKVSKTHCPTSNFEIFLKDRSILEKHNWMGLERKLEEEKQVQLWMFAAWVSAEKLPVRRE